MSSATLADLYYRPIDRSESLTMRERLERCSIPEPNTGCHLWTGTTTPRGYGQLQVDYQRIYAHRASYEEFVGPIPKGLTIDHLCRTPECINPDHLEAVTLRENILRSSSPAAVCARHTHCPNGHEFTEQTTYRYGGTRLCKVCISARMKAKRNAK